MCLVFVLVSVNIKYGAVLVSGMPISGSTLLTLPGAHHLFNPSPCPEAGGGWGVFLIKIHRI